MTNWLRELGISESLLIDEMTRAHEHNFETNWGIPGHCMCGGWQELVDALESVGIPADKMSMDPLLRQTARIKRKRNIDDT
jgi:hypothetical protein